jgi:hypothetical protein
MNTENPNSLENFEEQLRAAAPALPPAFRTRTLARCAAQARNRQQNRRRGSQRLIWSLAGLCLFQWLVVSLLDSQHASLLMAGSTDLPPQYSQTSTSKNPPADLWSALATRSQTLASLNANRDEWEISPESG